MVEKVFGIYDLKAVSYKQLFNTTTVGEAERGFRDTLLSEVRTIYSTHPEDYDLHILGDFDSVTGALIPFDRVVTITTGAAVKTNALNV